MRNIIVLLLVVIVLDVPINEAKSCSRKCKRSRNNETDDSGLFPCSCSPSCAVYDDCCADSSYKKRKRLDMVCLPINGVPGIQKVLAVGGCPNSWLASSRECENGLGHWAIVSSRTTGVTYTNIYCARCNRDDTDLIVWRTKTNCCEQSRDTANYRQKNFVVINNDLWIKLENKNKSLDQLCECKYEASNGRDEKFWNKLELRSCSRLEVSKCYIGWNDKKVRDLCKSYLDPVYVNNTLYRNEHCAICNYEKKREFSCVPAVVNEMWLIGFTDSNRIMEVCRNLDIKGCVHYIISLSRGKPYAFSTLLEIKQQKDCTIPEGRNCCLGYMYQRKRDRCRRVIS